MKAPSVPLTSAELPRYASDHAIRDSALSSTPCSSPFADFFPYLQVLMILKKNVSTSAETNCRGHVNIGNEFLAVSCLLINELICVTRLTFYVASPPVSPSIQY